MPRIPVSKILICLLPFPYFREDILVFLTGQEEIETMTQQIRQICLHEESLNHSFRTATKMIPLPLYASQQTFGQQVTF